MKEKTKQLRTVFILLISLCFCLNVSAQTQKTTGIVLDEQRETVIGASVIEVGNPTNGTITDAQGRFTISTKPDAKIQITFIGYVTQTINPTNQIVEVMMKEDTQMLDEVTVVSIGYGTARKKDLTGSIASVSGKQFEVQALANPVDMLRGTVAGFNASIGSSAKGDSEMEIRGQTSLGGNNKPMIVLDGAIYYGDFSDINMNDILSIDVMKDASSAAVYGSRAAGGVVLVTTKKGESSKPIITFNGKLGFSVANNDLKPRSPEGYLQQRSDYMTRSRSDQPAGYYSNPKNLPAGVTIDQWRGYDSASGNDDQIWFSRINLDQVEQDNYFAGNTINWFDETYQTGMRNDYSVSVSGKNGKTSYYTSIGYVDNQGVVKGDEFKSIRGRINVDTEVTDFIKIGINTQFSSKNEGFTPADTTATVYASPYGSKYEANGSLKSYPNNDALAVNPYLYLNGNGQDYKYDIQSLANTVFAEIKLPFNIRYRINWNTNFSYSQNYKFIPSSLPNGAPGGYGERIDGKSRFWSLDNLLMWNKTFGAHALDVTLLYNAEEDLDWESKQTATGFSPNEYLSFHQLSSGSSPVISDSDNKWTGSAMMARVNYNLLDRYLLTFSIRRDGFSGFGQGNPYATFPGAALAWRISDEDFFQSNLINHLKLRLSYGENGNRMEDQYLALARLKSTKYIYGTTTNTGVFPDRMANKSLQWESTASYNTGIDISLWNNRLSASVDAYSMVTTNQIINRRLMEMIGYTSVAANLGEVQNKGLEINLKSVNIKNETLNWQSSLVFSMNRNKIVHLYGEMTPVYDADGKVIGQREGDDVINGWYIGHATDQYYDYKVLGVYQLGQEEEASKYGKKPGDFILRDGNGDGKVDGNLVNYLYDKEFQGYAKPRYRLSLNNDFNFLKNFDASFMLTAWIGHSGISNMHTNNLGGEAYRLGRMNYYDVPYWTPENPTNEWGRLDALRTPAFSYFKSKTFLKLQNVSISYTVPQKLIKNWGIERCQLFINGQNLFTISGWDKWDPETDKPTPTTYSFGINLTL